MTANKYYPKQMNGIVISAFGQARDDEYSDAETIQKYLYKLSIDTANETELENIGRLTGYPRPLVPEGFNEENILLLGDLPLGTDLLIGLADNNESIGGELTTANVSETGFMSLGTYRKFLKNFAVIKRYGITIQSIEYIASLISDNFNLNWEENGDITIHYTKAIGYKNLWILSQLFYRVATTPQIIITAAN